MGFSRIWATKYGIFDVRNGSVTYTELQKTTCHSKKGVVQIIYTCHGEKRGCHGSELPTMVFLT